MHLSQEVIARFHSKTSKAPNGCILWMAGKFKDGYGGFWHLGQMRRAHRIAWEITKGPICDSQLQVLHRCDNPLCVNSEHLFLGTIAENMIDRDKKGRGLTGERCNTSKLKIADVRTIRQSELSPLELAERYNVSWRTIYHIRDRQTWKEA